MEKHPFLQLKDSPLFLLARVDYGTVVWPGNIDISPETLYDRPVLAGLTGLTPIRARRRVASGPARWGPRPGLR